MDSFREQYCKSKKLPINLLRKAQREKRNRNEVPPKKKRSKKEKLKEKDFYQLELGALMQSTELELRKILESDDVLGDIPCDSTPEELLGQIALANGEATTVYVQRDGLSQLTIVLPQQAPTIAQLKRAIEVISRVQLKREQQQQHMDHLHCSNEHNASQQDTHVARELQHQHELEREHESSDEGKEIHMPTNVESFTGELVCSVTRNGHNHRTNVSWRFLWRAYALFDVNTRTPIDDRNGRRLLSECGIENGAILKFCKRENYFGRKRQ